MLRVDDGLHVQAVGTPPGQAGPVISQRAALLATICVQFDAGALGTGTCTWAMPLIVKGQQKCILRGQAAAPAHAACLQGM